MGELVKLTAARARRFLRRLKPAAYRYAYALQQGHNVNPPRGMSDELAAAIARALAEAQGQAAAGAVAVFAGRQELPKGGHVELWNLLVDIPGHPKGSTVTRATVEAAGHKLPKAGHNPRRRGRGIRSRRRGNPPPAWLDTPGTGFSDPEGSSGDLRSEAQLAELEARSALDYFRKHRTLPPLLSARAVRWLQEHRSSRNPGEFKPTMRPYHGPLACDYIVAGKRECGKPATWIYGVPGMILDVLCNDHKKKHSTALTRRNPMSKAARKAYPSIAALQDRIARAARRGPAAVARELTRDMWKDMTVPGFPGRPRRPRSRTRKNPPVQRRSGVAGARPLYPVGQFNKGATFYGRHYTGGLYKHRFDSRRKHSIFSLPDGSIQIKPLVGVLSGTR